MPFWMPFSAEAWEQYNRELSAGKNFWSPNTYALMLEAKTLRERVFARLFVSIIKETEVRFRHQGVPYSIELKRKSLRGLMAACRRDPVMRKVLGRIPFAQGTTVMHGDPEIHECLQDLADVVCWEASESFSADYFPGVIQVDALDDEHVQLIMKSMQREMDREGNRTGIAPAVFAELPWERQVALADRRRWWFTQFAIPPKQWKKGYFSLWNVNNTITWPPDGYYCLSGTTPILTERGWVPIKKIVEDTKSIKVATIEEDGTLAWKFVRGRHTNKLNGRKLFTFRRPQGFRHKTDRRILLTEDHPILTHKGWLPVGKIANEPIFVATAVPAPNTKMMELITGTLLGDASVNNQGQLAFQQTDVEYGQLKQWALSYLGAKGYAKKSGVNSVGWFANPAWCTHVNIKEWSKRLRRHWYPNDKKQVPKDVELTDLALAVWWMDDGCFNGRKGKRPGGFIHAQGFTLKERRFLVDLLNGRGIKSKAIASNKGMIGVSCDGMEVLMKLIGRFVPPTMRRKVSDDAPSYDLGAWVLGKPVADWEPIMFIEDQEADIVDVYCLDVDGTHNFVTKAGAVHNCRWDHIPMQS